MITKKDMSRLPYIIAIDFDGTLVEDKFPEIGQPNIPLFNKLIGLKNKYLEDIKLVLWTSRHGVNLTNAVNYCENKGLVFDVINRNIPEVITMFETDTRKIYADLYLDDKTMHFLQFERYVKL